MGSAGTDFHVVGLQQRAALIGPVRLEGEDDLLEGQHEEAGRRGAGLWKDSSGTDPRRPRFYGSTRGTGRRSPTEARDAACSRYPGRGGITVLPSRISTRLIMPAPILRPDTPLFIVLNAGSGRSDTDSVRREIETICEAAGRPVRILLIDGPNRAQALAREAVESARAVGGIVVAAGGDGTINTVAQATLGSGCAFGVLPQGTFNYFSRANGIPAETSAALDILFTEQPREVQVGLVNDRVFLVNASMGLYAELLEEREAVKREYGRSRLVAFGAALMTMLRGHRQWDLHLAFHGTERDIRTPTLFVGNNPLQLRQVGLAEAEMLEKERLLAAVALKPAGMFGLAGLLLRGALGRLGAAEGITSFAFESLTVKPRTLSSSRKPRRVKVATDGELGWLDMPLLFRVAPESLWLIRPEVAPELEAAKQ